jgi:hypothetical protein
MNLLLFFDFDFGLGFSLSLGFGFTSTLLQHVSSAIGLLGYEVGIGALGAGEGSSVPSAYRVKKHGMECSSVLSLFRVQIRELLQFKQFGVWNKLTLTAACSTYIVPMKIF